MTVKPIPDGYHSLTPYLVCDGAVKLIEFIEKAFGGKEVHERMMKGDKVGHAEMQIGTSKVMIADAMPPEYPSMPLVLYFYVENVDAVYKKSIELGAKSINEPQDMFYGDRHGGVIDPLGNKWWIATHIEDLTPEQIKQRAEEFMKKQPAGACC